MAFAWAMEVEAADRYAELADLMATHHNREVSGLFAKLARIEGKHRDQIAARMGWATPPDAAVFRWETPEGPETTDYGDLHYLMQPWHALKLAEHNEQRAVEFFTREGELAPAGSIERDLYRELAAEEREHVALLTTEFRRWEAGKAGIL